MAVRGVGAYWKEGTEVRSMALAWIKDSQEFDGACRSSSSFAVTDTSPKLLALPSFIQLNRSVFPACGGCCESRSGASSLDMI